MTDRAPLACPICHSSLMPAGASLACEKKHTFDIARQGYVNLLTRKPDTLYEDKALFQARRLVYGAGFFDPLLDALRPLVVGIALDAGCGEGSLAAALGAQMGLDISKQAVQMAAAVHKGIAWCVADLCNIPLPDASADTILNVLTPANYGEFLRVLKPGGRLLKVIPGDAYLREIRALTGKSPAAHSADDAIRLFARHMPLRETIPVRYAVTCSAELAAAVFAMTPLTAHEERRPVEAGEITVDLIILVGEKE